jgi:hypothetical protein
MVCASLVDGWDAALWVVIVRRRETIWNIHRLLERRTGLMRRMHPAPSWSIVWHLRFLLRFLCYQPLASTRKPLQCANHFRLDNMLTSVSLHR